MARKKTASSTEAKKKTAASAQAQTAESSPRDIEEAAYYHWLNRGCPEGDSWADWCEAEKEMESRENK